MFDAEGRFSGYRGVASDLTDRRRAEQALRRSEAYLAEAQRLSRTGSWAWKIAPQEITHWSQEMFRLYALNAEAGIPPFEALQQRVHPEDRDKLAKAAESAIREGAEYELDFRVVLPGAEIRAASLVAEGSRIDELKQLPPGAGGGSRHENAARLQSHRQRLNCTKLQRLRREHHAVIDASIASGWPMQRRTRRNRVST